MNEWLLLSLAGLNLLVLLVVLFRVKAAAQAQQDKFAEPSVWQEQQFAALQAQTERLERELRSEISQSAVQGLSLIHI